MYALLPTRCSDNYGLVVLFQSSGGANNKLELLFGVTLKAICDGNECFVGGKEVWAGDGARRGNFEEEAIGC